MTKNRVYELRVPEEIRSGKELVSGKTISLDGSLSVGPKSTVVLYTGRQKTESMSPVALH